jgi:hypothetical protein
MDLHFVAAFGKLIELLQLLLSLGFSFSRLLGK